MSEPDDLKGIDLSAWDVPEPPDDLADAVVARLGGTDITPAIPVEPPKRRSRALIISGVAAAVVAVSLGLWTLVGSTDRAAPTNGVVSAQFAQQLSLDGITADLDVGANVQWTRDARTVHVQQRTGSAAWRIAADQRLVITAGASMVEASGKSSLRVEVKMNKVERVVGASAFAAAAAATVTLIVYDGKVTIENPQHERVAVAPGTTYTVEPPVEERTVGIAPPVTVAACNLDTCILDNWAGPCCSKYEPTPTLTSAQINETMTGLHDQIDACGQSYPATGQVDVRVQVRGDGSVASVVISKTPDATLGECVSQVISSAHFHPSDEAMTVFTFPLVFPSPLPPPPPARCDAKAERERGDDAMAQGKHAEALVHYELAAKCVADPTYVRLAFVAACNAKNQAKAKLYFQRLTPSERDKYRVICIRNSVDVDDNCDAAALKTKGLENVDLGQYAAALVQFEASLRCKQDPDVVVLAGQAACKSQNAAKVKQYKATCSSCDADELKNKGMEEVNMGQHAAALALFEQSLACKSDSYVVALTFMAACNSQNAAKARKYYGQLSPVQQSKYKMMCERNHVDLRTKCDADALKDSGMQKINEGSHAEALALFEQSIACKPDSYVTQLAFMEACNSGNAAKAREYWGQLSPAGQTKYKVICERNKIDVFDTSGDTKGYLQVFSKPAARILIDGVDTGLTTPISGKALALTPGKHKVTYVIGQDRYTYFVTTKSGQTDTMTKDLQ